MKCVRVREGVKESTGLYIHEEPIPTPNDDQVLIKVYAAGVNRADIVQRKGMYPPPTGASDIIGLEVAGIVESVGAKVTEWKKGDRVMSLLDGGGYAEYALAHRGVIMRVPDNLSFELAACLPEVYMTAFQTAFYIGKVDKLKRKTVLIHAAASGVGTALVQLCVAAGVQNIIATCSSGKIQQVKDLGATLVIDRQTDWAKTITDTVGGVDFILDPVGKDYFEKNITLMNPDAQFVGIASMSGAQSNIDLGVLLRKRLTVQYSTLRARSAEYKTDLVSELVKWTDNLKMFQDGRLKPVLSETYNLEDVAKAHDFMESNGNVGKIILRVAEE
jgi:putative PIG3 family NAD(P)H quinone oxidoreductase